MWNFIFYWLCHISQVSQLSLGCRACRRNTAKEERENPMMTMSAKSAQHYWVWISGSNGLFSYKDSNILAWKEILSTLLILPWPYFLLVLVKAAHRWYHGWILRLLTQLPQILHHPLSSSLTLPLGVSKQWKGMMCTSTFAGYLFYLFFFFCCVFKTDSCLLQCVNDFLKFKKNATLAILAE